MGHRLRCRGRPPPLAEELLEHFAAQPGARLGADAMVWRRHIEIVAQKPAVSQMQAHLLSQAPFRSDAVEVTDEQHLENDDRVERWLAGMAVERSAKAPDEGEINRSGNAVQ